MAEFESKLEKKSDEKRLVDKTLSTGKMLQSGKLSVAEIANMLNVSEDFVQEVQSKL